jgi:hypothetical protein
LDPHLTAQHWLGGRHLRRIFNCGSPKRKKSMSVTATHPAVASHLAAAASHHAAAHVHHDAAQAHTNGHADEAKKSAATAHAHSEVAQKKSVEAHTASSK